MKCIVIDEFGPPAKVLHTVDRPVPEPGPGQVRMRLVLAPMHNHNLSTIAGRYGERPPLPHYPGTEALGVIDKLGEGVAGLQVGQRVTGQAISTWAESYVGAAEAQTVVTEGIDDATACQLTSMPRSAVRVLLEMDVHPGDWIAQNAANGAVGKVLARIAAERGIRVLNVVRRDAAVAELAAEGIGEAVSTEQPGWQERALAITGGAPIRRVLDSVGGTSSDELMSLLAEEGWLIYFGALSGKPLQASPPNLLYKRATIKGFWGARPSSIVSPQQMRDEMAKLVASAAAGRLRLPVSRVFDLDHPAEAAAAHSVPGRGGKIAFRP